MRPFMAWLNPLVVPDSISRVVKELDIFEDDSVVLVRVAHEDERLTPVARFKRHGDLAASHCL